MDLILDIGNTNTKLAVFNDGELLDIRLSGPPSLSEIQDLVCKYPEIRHCILSTVIAFPDELRSFLQTSFEYIELDEYTPVPVINLYKTASTLGKDRLAAAVAGAAEFPGENVLVINTGTCVTYDFINTNNQYLGGAISPGMKMRFKSLNTFTAKLPLISFKEIHDVTGNTTEDSILSGVIFGMTGEMETMAGYYKMKYPGLKVILSGGDLINFDKRLKVSIFAIPNIVIHGLHKILEFNVKKTL